MYMYMYLNYHLLVTNVGYQVMKNIMTYLCEVESTLKQADASSKSAIHKVMYMCNFDYIIRKK